MKRNWIKIIFLGTPLFAKTTLSRLFDSGFDIQAVVTAPDKEQGRGRKVKFSEVKEYALSKQLMLLQPVNLKDPDFVEQLKSINPDLAVVVAFRMLPEVVWNIPKIGTINLHASLLPQYRGAAPINWAIMNGESTSGVTTFFINAEIDKGEILLQEEVQITAEDNAGSLHDKLMLVGAELVITTIDGLVNGNLRAKPQEEIPEENLRTAPKLFKENTRISWNSKAVEVHNRIKGLSPYPGAWSELINPDSEEKISFKVFGSEILPQHDADIAEIKRLPHGGLAIGCGDGNFLKITEIQLAGKKRMNSEELLRGFAIEKYKINTK